MVGYRRNFVPGGTYFFTVCLADRRATTLTDHIHLLRSAVGEARACTFFDIDAMVVLPEHLHTIWTLLLATKIIRGGGAGSGAASHKR